MVIRNGLTIALALAVIPGCDDDDGVRRLSLYRSGQLGDVTVTAEVSLPGRTIQVPASELALDSDGRSGRTIETPRVGEMRVRFIITASPADTVGITEYTYALSPGKTYSAGLSRRTAAAGRTCIGCTSEISFPLRGSLASSTDRWWMSIYDAAPLCDDCVAQSVSTHRVPVVATRR